MPEVDRQQRGDERAAHPRQLEHHLVADEHPSLRALGRRVALHQALERQPAELGGRARDERVDHEQRQPEHLEREQRADRAHGERTRPPPPPRACPSEAGRDHVGQESTGHPSTAEHREPPGRLSRIAERERQQEQQEPARRRASRPRRSPATADGAPCPRRPVWIAGSARAAPRRRVREARSQTCRDGVDQRREIERRGRVHCLQAKIAERQRRERARDRDPAEPGVRPHQTLAREA